MILPRTLPHSSLLGLAPSGIGRARARRSGVARAHTAGIRREARPRERGVALILAAITLMILASFLTDLHSRTTTAYVIASSARDQLRAEYMARSGLNLTRLLVSKEPEVRQIANGLYQAILQRPAPMIPIWNYANDLLQPFCDFDAARGMDTGYDLDSASGLGSTDSGCTIVSFAENSKINVNKPLNFAGDTARRSIAMQLYAMMGGYQAPSPYDPLFQNRDADGQFSSRNDVLAAMIDWWDTDTDRTNFDPGSAEVSTLGSEDDFYQRLDDRYMRRNAPFDSLEELRLVRGVSDDFWATFVEPDPLDPQSRAVTIYGSGSVNPNEAPPLVLLARACSFAESEALCTDQAEAAKFIQLLSTARALLPIPFFSTSANFMEFMEGRGTLWDLLVATAPEELRFTPMTFPAATRREADNAFVTAARILTIDVTGHAGCEDRDSDNGICMDYRAQVRLRTVVNFHDRWTPPAGNSGTMPPLGIYHYYRVE